MNAKHTPGPWRAGKDYGAIVANVPTDGPNGADHVEAYGGYLVCESVARKNMPIIIAATDLLEAVKSARDVLATAIRANWEGATDDDVSNHVTIKRLDAAIAKATGAA